MDVEDASTIGARARMIRRRRGLSLEVVAGLAGITAPSTSVAGTHCRCKPNWASKTCEACAVRDRITWAYALGLELEDPGIHAIVCSEFRSRLVAGDLAGSTPSTALGPEIEGGDAGVQERLT